ncbi:hypothetical protein B0G77_7280 [Paraburkholderia sp. BL10I2N1]|nr:hypothetical protein B0G77_7280 [Paraburkholderia sp. BL10I2N1]
MSGCSQRFFGPLSPIVQQLKVCAPWRDELENASHHLGIVCGKSRAASRLGVFY